MLREHRDILDEIRSTLEGKIEFVLLDLAKYEMERLARAGSYRASKIVRLTLDNLERWKIKVVEAPYGPRDVDLVTVIYALTRKHRVIVATVDGRLLETLTRNNIPSLRPKHQSGLIASWKT